VPNISNHTKGLRIMLYSFRGAKGIGIECELSFEEKTPQLILRTWQKKNITCTEKMDWERFDEWCSLVVVYHRFQIASDEVKVYVNGDAIGGQNKKKYRYPPVTEMYDGMNIIGGLSEDSVDSLGVNFEYLQLGTISAFSTSLSPKEITELANASKFPGFRGKLLLSLPSFCESISAKVVGDMATATEHRDIPATFPDYFRKNPALQVSCEKEVVSIAHQLLRIYPQKLLFAYNARNCVCSSQSSDRVFSSSYSNNEIQLNVEGVKGNVKGMFNYSGTISAALDFGVGNSHGLLLPNTHVICTYSMREAFHTLGGGSVLFPLLLPLIDNSANCAIPPSPISMELKLSTDDYCVVFSLLVEILRHSIQNTQNMQKRDGMKMLIVILAHIPGKYLSLGMIQSMKDMISVFASNGESISTQIIGLGSMLFEFRIWSRAAYPVQQALLKLLLNCFRHQSVSVGLKKVVTLQDLLYIYKTCYGPERLTWDMEGGESTTTETYGEGSEASVTLDEDWIFVGHTRDDWILKDPFPFFGKSENISCSEIFELRAQVADIIAWWIFHSGAKMHVPGMVHETTRFSNESLHLVLRYMHTEVDDALVVHIADMLLHKLVNLPDIERKVFLDALQTKGGYFLWFSLAQRASDSTRTAGIALLHSHSYHRKILIGHRFSSWLTFQLERYPLSQENYAALMKMMLGIKPHQKNIALNAMLQEPAIAHALISLISGKTRPYVQLVALIDFLRLLIGDGVSSVLTCFSSHDQRYRSTIREEMVDLKLDFLDGIKRISDVESPKMKTRGRTASASYRSPAKVPSDGVVHDFPFSNEVPPHISAEVCKLVLCIACGVARKEISSVENGFTIVIGNGKELTKKLVHTRCGIFRDC